MTILIPGTPAVNELGEETEGTPTAIQVENVIVCPQSQADSTDAQRPAGTSSGYTLYIPRAWPWRSLRRAHVMLRGSDVEWRVVGDPRPIRTDLHPTAYWPVGVQVVAEEG